MKIKEIQEKISELKKKYDGGESVAYEATLLNFEIQLKLINKLDKVYNALEEIADNLPYDCEEED